ncbi:MAG: SURF1 family protein [Burkholderiaceae bacterium]
MAWRRRIVPAVAALLVIGLTVSLGNWQVRRAHEKQAIAKRQQRASSLPPLSLNAQPPAEAGRMPDPARRVVALGRFLPDKSILIDNRTHDGVAGFHLLTPIRLDDEPGSAAARPRIVLVLRGWVAGNPADRWAWPDFRTPEGRIEIEGEPQAGLPQSLQLGRESAPGPGDRIWQFFSVDKYQHWSGLSVEPFIIRQTSNLDDGLIRAWPRAGSDVDRHYGYAFQWYGLAVVTVVLWIWYGRRRRSRGGDRL